MSRLPRHANPEILLLRSCNTPVGGVPYAQKKCQDTNLYVGKKPEVTDGRALSVIDKGMADIIVVAKFNDDGIVELGKLLHEGIQIIVVPLYETVSYCEARFICQNHRNVKQILRQDDLLLHKIIGDSGRLCLQDKTGKTIRNLLILLNLSCCHRQVLADLLLNPGEVVLKCTCPELDIFSLLLHNPVHQNLIIDEGGPCQGDEQSYQDNFYLAGRDEKSHDGRLSAKSFIGIISYSHMGAHFRCKRPEDKYNEKSVCRIIRLLLCGRFVLLVNGRCLLRERFAGDDTTLYIFHRRNPK